MPSPVLLPAGFVRLAAERFFFAVADGLDVVGGDATLNQGVAHRIGAGVAVGQVVFSRAALVTVSLDTKVDVLMLAEEFNDSLQRCFLIRTDVVLIVIVIYIHY